MKYSRIDRITNPTRVKNLIINLFAEIRIKIICKKIYFVKLQSENLHKRMSGRKRSRSPLITEENDDDDYDFDENCSTSKFNGCAFRWLENWRWKFICENFAVSKNPPIQRNAANARERARMRVLSSAFCRLKTKLPWVPADTKLSKLDTLRLATIYIQQLRTCLARDDSMNHDAYSSIDGLPMISANQPSLVRSTFFFCLCIVKLYCLWVMCVQFV